MPQIPQAYRAVIIDQQAQLQRLVQSAGIAPVRALYDEMLRDLEIKLGASASGSFTAQQLRGYIAQIKLGLVRLIRSSGEAVEDGADRVGIHAARTMLLDSAALEHHFTGAILSIPLLQSARLKGLVADKTSSLLRVHERSMARYGTSLVRRFESALGTSLGQGESQTQAIDRISDLGGMAWYGAERIVRTEMSFAASASAREAADEQAEELDGDMWSRWTEHVNDAGAPLDERVGVDSMAMHGQVASPGGMFTQPPMSPSGRLVSESLIGEQWACPPNRPNDRAVLVPWRASWGIPAWRWDGGRIPVTDAHVERTNSRWMRDRGADLRSTMRPQRQPIAERFRAPGADEEPTVSEDVEEAPTLHETEMTGPGFVSPIPQVPTHETVADALDRTGADSVRQQIPAKSIADEGWFERPAEIPPQRLERELEAIRAGEQAQIDAIVAPSGAVVMKDGRAALHAAVQADAPVTVHWSTGREPGKGHVQVGGDSPYRTPVTPQPPRDLRKEFGIGSERIAGTRPEDVERHEVYGPKDVVIPEGWEIFTYNGIPWVRPIEGPAYGHSFRLRDVRSGDVNLLPRIAKPKGLLSRIGSGIRRLFGASPAL